MSASGIPRHQQIAEHLKTEIINREFVPGDKLPSEKRLCDYFNVSRITVRQALKTLQTEGLIFKKQGLGAFVSERRSKNGLVHLTDFNEDMRRAGFSPSSKLIRFKKVKGKTDINSILEIPPEKKLIRIDRVRLGNNKPVAFDITWLPGSYGQLLLDEDLTQKTIYEILEDEYSISITGGQYTFTSSAADEYLAGHLEVKKGTPLLQINRCSRSTGDKKVYYQKRYNNPAFISYSVELLRSEESNESSREGLPFKEFTPDFNL